MLFLPRITKTKMIVEMDDNAIEAQLKSSSLNKACQPESIAKALKFLGDDDNDHITGQFTN